jgi:hypothetical protein
LRQRQGAFAAQEAPAAPASVFQVRPRVARREFREVRMLGREAPRKHLKDLWSDLAVRILRFP